MDGEEEEEDESEDKDEEDEEMEEEEEEELDSVSNVKKEATKSKAMMAPSNFRAMAAKTATSNRH